MPEFTWRNIGIFWGLMLPTAIAIGALNAATDSNFFDILYFATGIAAGKIMTFEEG